MRLTTTAKSYKISVSSTELSDLVEKLGFQDISEMINEGMTDLIGELAEQIKVQKGIDITQGREENVPVAVMIINGIMLIEVPKKDVMGGDIEVVDRPEERFKGFMEHLKQALEEEAAKSGNENTNKVPKEKEETREYLYKVSSIGEAMRGAAWVKKGWIIRWKKRLYIKTSEYSAALLEHFEGKAAPKFMQEDEIISFIKDGRVCKYDSGEEV